MKYLMDVLGIEMKYSNWDDEKNLPYLITDRYDFKLVSLAGVNTVFMYIKGDMDAIFSVKKHISKVQHISNFPVVLILNECLPRQRKSLIDARQPFVAEGKQAYLPFMGVALQEKYDIPKKNHKEFIPSAQVLLFNYIYSKKKEMQVSDAVASLGYSAMSITRAVRQLEQIGLIRTYKKGVNKFFISDYYGVELYEKGQKYLRSPVQKKIFIDRTAVDADMLYAGYSALSEYSMMNAPNIPVFAADNIGNFISENELIDAEKQAEVEIWNYNPKVLADSRRVDILSLYQSMKNDMDERVQEELENVLRKFWEEYM